MLIHDIGSHAHNIYSYLMFQHCRNWVSSSEPLDTPVEFMLPDCPRVSAGTLVILCQKSGQR